MAEAPRSLPVRCDQRGGAGDALLTEWKVRRCSCNTRRGGKMIPQNDRLRAAVADERSALLRDPPACLVRCGDLVESHEVASAFGDASSLHLDLQVKNTHCAATAVRFRLLFSDAWCRPAVRGRSESEVRRYIERNDGDAVARPCSVRVFVLSILININVEELTKGSSA